MYNVVMVMTWLMYEHIPISSTLAKFLRRQHKKHRNVHSVPFEASSNSVCFGILSIIIQSVSAFQKYSPKDCVSSNVYFCHSNRTYKFSSNRKKKKGPRHSAVYQFHLEFGVSEVKQTPRTLRTLRNLITKTVTSPSPTLLAHTLSKTSTNII